MQRYDFFFNLQTFLLFFFVFFYFLLCFYISTLQLSVYYADKKKGCVWTTAPLSQQHYVCITNTLEFSCYLRRNMLRTKFLTLSLPLATASFTFCVRDFLPPPPRLGSRLPPLPLPFPSLGVLSPPLPVTRFINRLNTFAIRFPFFCF